MVSSPLRTLLVVAVVCAKYAFSSNPLHHLPTAAWQAPTAVEILFPAPMVPDAGDVVAVGSPALVAWNASAMPLGSAVISRIDLYHNTTTAMSEYVANLAENVDPRAGAINYTVPDVQPGTYTVVIGGVDGPCSGVFRIEPRWKTPAMPDGGAGWTLGVDGLVGDIPQRPAGASPLQQHSLHARAAHHETGVLSSRPKHSLDNLTVQAPASGPSGANLFHGRQFGGMRLQVAAA